MSTPAPGLNVAAPAVSVLTAILAPDPVHFRSTVESVLGQTYTDFEYVVVEDPSPASAGAILADYPDPRIRHFRNAERTSLLAQRNKALEMARGEFIAWIDGDDECAPQRLAAQVKFLREHPEVDLVGSQLTYIDETGKTLGRRDYPLSHSAIVRQMPRLNPLAHSCVMARRQTMLDAGGYAFDAYRGCEDYELWCRMATQGRGFANLPERLIRYRIHPGQFKSQSLRDTIKGTLAIKRMHYPRDYSPLSLLRATAERGLLCLPPSWVLRLFLRLQR
ncbi:glycosyltransferase [Lignipirellula cremea]|uniref:Glycosyltransferase EpsE n=1 Tax=Lignipirellula cremea TaxID=2528010 RepID=A0A518DYM8_9BACT|nr:glycosyltransferase [Lignipirellula cremea]QDU96950.1 Putative glycosyltransferase EpsE [Lignipirellula cremea]